jgi:hypothetical protein
MNLGAPASLPATRFEWGTRRQGCRRSQASVGINLRPNSRFDKAFDEVSDKGSEGEMFSLEAGPVPQFP